MTEQPNLEDNPFTDEPERPEVVAIQLIKQEIQTVAKTDKPPLDTYIALSNKITNVINDKMITVKSNNDLTYVADVQNLIKWVRSKIEHHRKDVVDPLNKQVKDENDLHRSVDRPLAEWDGKIEDNKKAFQRQEMIRVANEQAAAATKARLELERKLEQERQAQAAQAKAEREAALAEQRMVEAMKQGDADAAAQAEAEANQALYEAQQAAQKADTVAPLIPVAVSEQVEQRVTSVRTETGTQSSLVKYTFRLASPDEANLETSHIPKKFWKLSDLEFKSEVTIGKLVRSKVWTKDKELNPLEFTIVECPGIIVVKDISNRARVG